MGELIDFNQRLAAKQQQHVPQIEIGIESAKLAAQENAALVYMVEQGLSGRGAKIKFPKCNVPTFFIECLNISRPDTSIINMFSAPKYGAVQIGLSPDYTLPKVSRVTASDSLDQVSANALFVVAYGLATHAQKNSNRKNIPPLRPNQAVWQQTTDVLPIADVSALRAAGFVVRQHFDIEPLHGYRHTNDTEKLLAHIAAMYDPLDRPTARTLYSPLG